MTNNIKKWLSATFAIGMIATIIGVFGFNLDAKESEFSKTANTHIWEFEGGPNDILDPNAYSYVPGSTPPTTCDGTDELPCYLLLESDNISALMTFLSNKDEQDVIDQAAATRSL